MLGASLAYTSVLLLLPDPAGTFLFGDNWSGSREILLPVALGQTAAAACLGPAVSIYALGLARKTFRLMTIEAPLVLTLMIGGALAFGVKGAAWGLAVNQIILVPLWFAQLRAILNRPLPTPAEPGRPGEQDEDQLPTPSLDGAPTGPLELGDVMTGDTPREGAGR